MTTDTTFISRRNTLLESIGEGGVLVLTSPPSRQRSRDTYFPYRASSDVVYLTGFEEPETVLVFAPKSELGEFVMFVRPKDPVQETWEGRRCGPDNACNSFGADAAFSVDELDEELPKYLENRQVLHYTLGVDQAFDLRVIDWMSKLRGRRGKPPAAPHAISDARDLIHEMRVCKSESEVVTMRKAAEITSEAHQIAMRMSKPGVAEFTIQAAIEHHFRANGATFPAYTSIVGSGDNATILHYVENKDLLADGEVVLIDAGCEYQYYAADITRSFPASGKFTPEHRDIYQAILEAQIEAINDVQVGNRYSDLYDRTLRRLSEVLVQFKFLEGSVDEVIETETYKQFYPHRVGHFLGMDVHDVGSYFDDSGDYRKLEPGMVVTIEPGLYFPKASNVPDAFKGLGIRIEDDILVSNDGPENLTISCPKSVDDIERIVGTDAN